MSIKYELLHKNQSFPFQVFDYEGVLGRRALKETNIPVALLRDETTAG